MSDASKFAGLLASAFAVGFGLVLAGLAWLARDEVREADDDEEWRAP